MKFDDKKIKEILLKESYVTKDDIFAGEEYARSHNTSIVDYLLSEGVLTRDLFGQALAEYYNLTYVNLKKEKIDPTVLHLIPEITAKSRGVVAFQLSADGVKVAMTDPSDLEALNFVEKRIGHRAIPFYTTPEDLEEALSGYSVGIADDFTLIVKEMKDKNVSKEEKDKLVVKMVDKLLQYGYESKSSDIHIEPYEEKILVRFRIDGVMHDVLDIDKSFLDFISTRIKILAKLRTDEHRAAQDGKLRFKSNDDNVDVRVSILPVTQGENIVLRLLTAKNRQYGLMDLGLAEHDLKKIREGIKHPHGMILVTGPTGSGKTTTLYSILKILNKRDVHISTIEDPVEYDIEGVSQIQVNPKTNLTFAQGLRSIVRQDPDIIMVGEIRDEETAGIAVNSALTGHLVLSTLHTNDAPTALPRLLDMGVEPFLVASTVNIIVAQRLVRQICPKCRTSSPLSLEQKTWIENDEHVRELFLKHYGKELENLSLYRGSGCKLCAQTGYTDRIGVFEVMDMGESIRELILKRASSDELREQAKKDGMTTMLEDGIDMVLNGVTTLEEVLRVTRE